MNSALLASGALALVLVSTSGWTEDTAGPRKDDHQVALPMVRYISATTDRAGRSDQITPMDLADLYTSLKITPYSPTATDAGSDPEKERAYSQERPSWVVRLFTNRTVNIVALANVTITDPDLPVSVPLFTIEHQIRRGSPDEYVSDYTSSHSATPLFRIGASSVFTLHVNEVVSDEQTLTGLSTLIKAVQTATTIAAPHAAILTALSSPDVNNAAQAIQTSISGLLSTRKTEDIELAHDVSLTFADMNGQPSVYSIAARAPSNYVKFSLESATPPDYDNKTDPAPLIGHWYIWLTCPRPSMFSAQDICLTMGTGQGSRPLPGGHATASSLNNGYPIDLSTAIKTTQQAIVARLVGRPSQILATKLSSQVTVEDFVTASDPYKSFFSNSSKQPSDTRKFCADVIDLLYKQGLSHFDARLVVWAMTRGLSDIIRVDTPAVSTPTATPAVKPPAIDIPSNCNDLVNPDTSGPNIPLSNTWGAPNPAPPAPPSGQ